MPKSMLITAGPTHEPIDSVRYIANRSSGKMGAALAEAARDRGWAVTLLLGPAGVVPPAGVFTVRFESTAELEALLHEHFPRCDVLIMAAAVADYRPANAGRGKIERGESLVLKLEPTPDLVARCAESRRPGQKIIGFALEEPDKLAARAVEKLRRKGLDAIVANPLATLGGDGIDASVYVADGTTACPEASGAAVTKTDFARWLIGWINGSKDAL